MTLDEARVLLGVDASTSADEVRRAYLRLVKQHRPEQDPTGFQRVREAYDLVRQLQSFQVDQVIPRALVVESSDADVAPVIAVDPGEAVPRLSVDDLEESYGLADALEAGDTRGAIRIWRAAVRARPDSAEARQRLVEAYTEAGDDERAARALLRGYRRGFDGFAAALLSQAPAHAPAELFERAQQDGGLAFAAAAGRLKQGDPDAALPYIAMGIRSEFGNSFQTASLVIAALGQLGKRGDVVRFRELAELFATHAKENQLVLWGPYAAQWLVLRELSLVADQLPAFVFKSLAGAVFETDAASLADDLSLFAEANPEEAKRAERALKEHAPRLHAAYGPLFAPAPRFRKGWSFGWMPVMPVIMLLSLLARLFVGSGGTTEYVEVPRPVPSTTWAPSFVVAPGQYDEKKVEQAVGELYSLARERGQSKLQDSLSAANRAFAGDCRRLAREIATVVEATQNNDAMLPHARTLWVEFARACPAQVTMVDAP